MPLRPHDSRLFDPCALYNKLIGDQSHDSQSTPSIAELGLPDETGIDPFTGKPLKIVRSSATVGPSTLWVRTAKTMAASVHDAKDYGVGRQSEAAS